MRAGPNKSGDCGMLGQTNGGEAWMRSRHATASPHRSPAAGIRCPSDALLGRVEAGLIPGHEVDEQRSLTAGSVLAPMNGIVRYPFPGAVLEVEPFVPAGRLVDAELGLDDFGAEAAGIPADIESLHGGGIEPPLLVPTVGPDRPDQRQRHESGCDRKRDCLGAHAEPPSLFQFRTLHSPNRFSRNSTERRR